MICSFVASVVAKFVRFGLRVCQKAFNNASFSCITTVHGVGFVENACYIDQISDSGAEIADEQELNGSAEWMIGNHISCCSKHAGFNIPV